MTLYSWSDKQYVYRNLIRCVQHHLGWYGTQASLMQLVQLCSCRTALCHSQRHPFSQVVIDGRTAICLASCSFGACVLYPGALRRRLVKTVATRRPQSLWCRASICRMHTLIMNDTNSCPHQRMTLVLLRGSTLVFDIHRVSGIPPQC